ncbi:ribonuclease Z, mitochondrial isoform X3 [Sitophilus oryzae]|nr:ribonuclease Z, mitochondrial isoform X3 [Sitophilus oryzae]
MPKEPRHVIAAQKQRIKIKQKSSKYVPGKVHLQILGTGAKGAPGAVYLFSDQSRYLFNCGEGTQRLAHEHKMKLCKLEQIFVTQTVWKNIGGLPGTALTIQDVGVPQITLHGPPGLNEIFLAAQRFVVLKNLKIKIADCSKDPFFEDNVMKVKYVSLSINETDNDKDIQATVDQAEAATSTRNERKSRKRSLSAISNNEVFEDNTDYFAHERKKSKRSRSRKRSRSLSQPPGSGTSANNSVQFDKNTLKEVTDNKTSVCYICCLQPRPGSLNLEKCVLKGVPPGPLLGRLKNREDVTLENGDTVKSSDVCHPDDPGPVFLVVDCPSEKYLECLITNTEIRKHQKFAEKDTDVACLVVHFTPSEVTRLPQYQKWIEDFIPSTHHIFINEDNTCMGSIAVHRIQHKLNLLSPNFFPLLNNHESSHIENLQHISNKKLKCDSVNEDNINRVSNDNMVDNNSSRHSIRKFGALYSFHLRPKKGPEDTSEIKLDPEEYVRETMTEEFVVVHNELKQKLTDAARSLTIKGYPKVLFLGTGSCIPNKTRNTSGILLHTSEGCNVVLDCGEGTYGQILRFYGPNDSETVLSNIKAIYISHLHADHHIGLIGLLQGRRRALNKLNMVKDPVYLFAPKQILAWLNFYDRCFESIGEEFILVPNGDLILNQELYPTNDKIELLERLQLQNINTCIVKHCPNAFGVAVVHKNGYKITYSGDTMPTDELIKLGMFSDVLIHEATMEDDLANEAVVKTHSTTSQAIEVGKLMEAKYTILTHFSQRYAKLPRFNENFSENVGIAFDNMLIKVDELPLLPLLYPALRIMFAEHYEEMEHKAIKRQLKSEKLSALISNDVNMS